MPEGHTIHRLAADHHRDFVGQSLSVSSPQGRFTAGARKLSGRTLTAVAAHGKHLLYDWEGNTLHVHLGLYGKFRRHKSPPPEPRGAVRLRVIGEEKAFDLNGPTACELLTKQGVRALLDRLGADPLRDDADPDKAWDRISRTRLPIGTVKSARGTQFERVIAADARDDQVDVWRNFGHERPRDSTCGESASCHDLPAHTAVEPD
jgi:endonuclease-8